jgi:alkaline phosphatase D
MKTRKLTIFGLLLLQVILATSELSGQYLRIMNGPVLGAVGPDYALVWVRGTGVCTMQVEYADNLQMTDSRRTDPVMLSKDSDYCATLRIEGLRAGSPYFYRILVNGKPDKYTGRHPPSTFKTAPEDDFKGVFRVAFGSCARFQYDRHQEIWTILPRFQPDLFFWIGDNIYGDSLDPDIIAEEYRRQRDLPNIVQFLKEVPQLATWDDHDFGINNSDRTNPSKAAMLEQFRLYWPNPSAGTSEAPGVFFHYRYGGVDFFFLDDRYHRDPEDKPDSPEKTHLGAAQLSWLKKQLSESDAVFKLIIAGGPWSTFKESDSWGDFLYERNGIFDFIRDESISGVVLVSGDTHAAELNVIPWSDHGGYDLYDLVSSPLAQLPLRGAAFRRPGNPEESRLRIPFTQSPNFGLIEFDLSGEPTLTFNVIGADGRPVWEPFVLEASDLVNGVSSWETKIDKTSRLLMGLMKSTAP